MNNLSKEDILRQQIAGFYINALQNANNNSVSNNGVVNTAPLPELQNMPTPTTPINQNVETTPKLIKPSEVSTEVMTQGLSKTKPQTNKANGSGHSRSQKNDETINKWSSPDYKMTKSERKEARNWVEDYYNNNDYAKRLKNANSPNAAMAIYNQLTDAEKNEYERMTALSNKISKGASFVTGTIDATPFAKKAEEKWQAKVNEGLNREGKYSYSDVSKMTQKQNPLPYLSGNMASKAAQYVTLGKYAKDAMGLPDTFGGRMLGDTAVDVGLDTIPNMIDDVQEGKSVGEILGNAGKNIAGNVAFNLLGEGLGYGFDTLAKNKEAKQLAQQVFDEEQAKQIAMLNDFNMGRQIDKAKQLINNADDVANATSDVTENVVKNADVVADTVNNTLDTLKNKRADVEEQLVRVREMLDNAKSDDEKEFLNLALNDLEEQAKTLDASINERSAIESVNNIPEINDNIPQPLNNVEETPLIPEMNDNIPEMLVKDTTPNDVLPIKETPTDIVNVDNTNNALDEARRLADTSVKPNENTVIDGVDVKERGYAESIQNKSDMPDEVIKEFADNKEVYNVLHNKDTKQVANDILASAKDTNDALNKTLILLGEKNPVAIPLGYDVAKQLINEGDIENATTLIRMMSESLTQSGQFSQAAAISLLQSNPMAALRYMEKQIDNLNSQGAKQLGKKWKDFVLTDEEKTLFANIKDGDTDAIKKAYEQISKRFEKEFPVSNWEKFVEYTKLSMLLNPRTHIRNFTANALLLPMRSISDRISALGQNISKLFVPDMEVTQSLVGGNSAQKKIAKEIFDSDFKELLDNSGKWNELNGIARNKQVFKGTALDKMGATILDKISGGKISQLIDEGKLSGSALEDLRNFDYYLLSTVEDDPFVKTNFVNRLASYMKAQGIDSIDNVPTDAKSIAWEEALKATFKDNNKMTDMLQNVKGNLGKFGEVLFPFTKTPANLAMRAIDYSPVGIANAITKYYKKGLNANNIGEFWDDMSKGITGTAGIYLGYKLADSGVITGALDDNKNKANFQKQRGKQAYSVNIGDLHLSYDWAQPAGTPLLMGAIIHDAIEAKDNEDKEVLNSILSGTMEGGKAAFDAWFGLSPLQTFSDVLGGNNGSVSESIADRAVQSVTDMPQRGIPAVLGATARAIDPTMRETYDKDSALRTYINQIKSKMPAIGDDDNWWNQNVASTSLPSKYDNWGRERIRNNSEISDNPFINAINSSVFGQFINPGTTTYDYSTSIDNQIQNIADTASNGNYAYPHTASWSVTVNGKDIKLSNEQHSEYQRIMGGNQYSFAKVYLDSVGNDVSADTKAETLNTLYGFSDALAKEKLFGYDVSNNTTYKKMYEEYMNSGKNINAVVDYLNNKQANANLKAELEDKGIKGNDRNVKVYNEKPNASTVLPELQKTGTTNKGKYTTSSLYKGLSSMNLTSSDKGYYIANMSEYDLPAKVQNIADRAERATRQSDKNRLYEDVWNYFNIKNAIDTNHNGSINKDERKLIPEVLNTMGIDESREKEITSWYEK